MFDFSETVPLPHLETEVRRRPSRRSPDMCAWLLALALFDRRRGWSGSEVRSCARWLVAQGGTSLRTAHEHLRVAHALERLPLTREALAAGRLSYSKARAITRVAEPADENLWLEHAAQCAANQLEVLVSRGNRRRRGNAPSASGAGRVHRLSWRWNSDGTLDLRGVLPADQGELLLTALSAARPPEAGDDPGSHGAAPALRGSDGGILDTALLAAMAAAFTRHLVHSDPGVGSADETAPHSGADPADETTEPRPEMRPASAERDGQPSDEDTAAAETGESAATTGSTASEPPADHSVGIANSGSADAHPARVAPTTPLRVAGLPLRYLRRRLHPPRRDGQHQRSRDGHVHSRVGHTQPAI